MNGLFVFGEEVPRVAALLDDVVVGVEDGDGEFVGAQVGPDVFDRVEFRCTFAAGRRSKHRPLVGGVDFVLLNRARLHDVEQPGDVRA